MVCYNANEKHSELLDTAGKAIHVCGCCGAEYIGALDAEPKDSICSVCGEAKTCFA